MFATTTNRATTTAATTAQGAVSQTANQAPAPFAFLGRIPEHGETVVLLHRAGRTLEVRGTGRVADDYEVEALLDSLLLLRHLPSGTQQTVELAARNADPGSLDPEDFPRD